MNSKKVSTIALLLLIIIALLIISKVKINNKYKNIRISEATITSKRYKEINSKIKIRSIRKFIKNGNYYANIEVFSTENGKLPLNKFLLYRGSENQPSKFIDMPIINKKRTINLNKGKNNVVIYTATPTVNNRLYFIENNSKGMYIKYKFDLN